MLAAFFNAKEIIHLEFMPEKQNVNGKFYIKDWSLEFIALGLSFRKVGPGIFCTTMHRRIHHALSSSFWRNKGSHPPCAPDLSPADFF
jgi:hypothetical protein